MIDDGVGRLQEFLGAEEQRGSLWNLVDPSRPSDQPPQICDNKAPLLGLVEISRLPNYYLYKYHIRSATQVSHSGKIPPERAPVVVLARLTYLQRCQALCMNQPINT